MLGQKHADMFKFAIFGRSSLRNYELLKISVFGRNVKKTTTWQKSQKVKNVRGALNCGFRLALCKTACATVLLLEIGVKTLCATVVLLEIGAVCKKAENSAKQKAQL